MGYFTKMYFNHGNEYVIYNSEWDEVHRTNSREENRLEMERLTGDSYAQENVMEKIVTIKATEREILDIINDHFGLEEDSIVALEELANQVWCVNVRASDADEDDMERILAGNAQFMVNSMLDQLALVGKLEDGNYQIDCTW